MGSSGCGAGAVSSKQTKQTSKGLVFDAVRVRWWCGGGAKQTSKDKQGLGAGCGCKGARVWAYLKARFGCWVKCGAVVLNGYARLRC